MLPTLLMRQLQWEKFAGRASVLSRFVGKLWAEFLKGEATPTALSH